MRFIRNRAWQPNQKEKNKNLKGKNLCFNLYAYFDFAGGGTFFEQ